MADVKQVSSGAKLESIGTIKTVVGTVKAVDQSGAERILQSGDKVYPNETIVTADGGLVLIEFADGSHIDLASASQIILNTEVFNPGNAKGEELTAEQIQEMIARGEDPTAVTEATAAGAGSGDEGGSSFVDVAFNNTKGHVNSGLETRGIPGPDSTTFSEQPPVEDDAVVLAALADESSTEETTTEETITEETPTDEGGGDESNTKVHANNGFGNGDQDAPGNSGPHNNAENAIDEEDKNGKDKGNNGSGNDNQDAPGNSGSHNNAENATDEDEGGEDSDSDEGQGNNGHGNGDQDAPGNSGSHNNAENATDEDEGGEESDSGEGQGNNGHGNGDQDAPGNSESHNNAENATETSGVTLTGNGNSNDILVGGDGDDTLIGGGGVDTMTGGAGADKFIWESGDLKKAAGGDTISDFSVDEGDTLNFDDLLASAGGTLGIVEAGGNTTVTLTTDSGKVDLVTLTGVTGETLNTLLGTPD